LNTLLAVVAAADDHFQDLLHYKYIKYIQI